MNLTPEDQNKILAQKLFENLVVKIRDTFKKTDEKDIPNKIPVCIFSLFFKLNKINKFVNNFKKLARVFLANLNSLNSLAVKTDILKKTSAFKCEMFLNVYQENLDLELDLEDTIHTIVNNDNPDHFISCMTFTCKICTFVKNRNKVNLKFKKMFKIYLFSLFSRL
jgi:hypothetical protein